jgi:hypothetical protein
MPVTGMAEHASSHRAPASHPVAGTLEFPISVCISMQQLDGFMLARLAIAPPAGSRVALPTSVTVATPLKRVQNRARLAHHC